MATKYRYERIAFIITAITHGKGDAVMEMLREAGVAYNIAAIGYTSMGLDLADYLGLTEVKRDVILSIVRESQAHETMAVLKYGFYLDEKRTGTAICVPIASVAGLRVLQYISGKEDVFQPPLPDTDGKEEPTMKTDYLEIDYRLIITIVSRGHADTAIEAAKLAGARGGTVIYARGAGVHDTEKFLNVPIEPEKEVILSLVKKEAEKEVMQAIMDASGLDQEGRGISFALPVTDVVGMATLEREEIAAQAADAEE